MNSILCERRVYSNIRMTHNHDYFQLLFPLRGFMEIKTKNQKINLTPSSLFLLTPRSTHTYTAYDHHECLVLDIPPGTLITQFDHTQLTDQYLSLNTKWKSIRHLLLTEQRDQGINENRLQLLVEYIFNHLFQETKSKFKSLTYIQENLHKPLSLEKIASIENYHPTYYSQWFKNQFGYSLSEYIQHLRLEKAKQLLRKTNLTVMEISFEVGYHYASSFNRFFMNHTGQTPAQYRENYEYH